MLIKSLAVFCGSSDGAHPLYAQHTEALGLLMAQNNISLVYGGGNVGLMGVIADAVIMNGGEAIGVIPQLLVDRERSHTGLTKLYIVADMHERKRKMYALCDAAMILPGGYGTMDEFFEMITWNNLSIHDKLIFVLNTKGYYTHLLMHIEKMQQDGFLYDDPFKKIKVIQDPEEMRDFLIELV